jgi:phospholipid transport system substrate-binding protein
MRQLIFGVILMMMALPAIASSSIEAMIKDTADKVLEEMRTNAELYKKDPQKIYELVDTLVLPHFDFASMTDLALGRYSEQVSPEQRPEIVHEFRLLLVRTYSSALLEYTDQKVVFLPMEGSEADGEVTVRAEIQQAGGFPIPIDYLLHNGEDGWKVVDVSVDDVSLVTNYRSSFARAIKKDGVDGLIQTLRARNESQ